MPNIGQVFKDEIQRLARKEIKSATAGLRKDTVTLKRTAADLKRRVAVLERENRRLVSSARSQREVALKAGGDTLDKARVTAKMIVRLRERLGLSQADLAALVGVSSMTVYQWEHKEGRLTFRGDAKARLVELRPLGKREVYRRLEELSA